ncbi:MAG: histidine phosphatase family protein [Burkholderiaceae bacterium]
MIDLIIVRHGETDWNRIRRLQGHTDIALNATGIEQAIRLEAALAGEPIAALHSSDLGRALATAMPVATALGLPIVEDALLRERNYGIFEGRTFPEILERFPVEAEHLRLRDASYTIPGGESQEKFFRRVVDAVSRIATDEERVAAASDVATKVLIVTHGGVLDMLYRAAFDLALDAQRVCEIPNGVINRLTYDRGRFAVVAWAEETYPTATGASGPGAASGSTNTVA